MIRKMPKWMAGLALALVAGAMPLACGGGAAPDDMGGAPSDEDGTGGTNTDGTGGTDTDGTGGTNTDGSGGTDGSAGAGTGGTAPVDASIDDLIAGICAWEFGCCNEGELTYRLGSAAGSSDPLCLDFSRPPPHESHVPTNPFPGGPAQGLL